LKTAVSPSLSGLSTAFSTAPTTTPVSIVSKILESTIAPKASADVLSYVPSTIGSQREPTPTTPTKQLGTPSEAPATKTTATPVGVVAPGSSISGSSAGITTPSPQQPSANITPQGAPQIETIKPAASSPSLSLAGGSAGSVAPTTPATTTITPERIRELLKVLLSRDRAGGLVETSEQIPLSYILQPRKLLGEEV
jgi:hypothetical protein